MAQLTSSAPWTAAQSRAQFAALAQLRWHLFRNAFRRKGAGGEIVARILFFPIIGIIAIGPILGAGFAAFFIVSSGRIAMLPLLTWGIFALWQIVSLNIAAPNLSFDINTIIRFPLSFSRYLAARLVFGLLSAANVIGSLALISADIGIGVARPSLLPWSTLLLAVFALANIFFTRMIFAWVDRWLSTRRAREFLTAFILFASLGLQYLNVNLNPGLRSTRHHAASHLPFLLKFFHRIQPLAALLPPGLAASSIIHFSQTQTLGAIASLLGLTIFGFLFFSVYAWRMQREFHGENLSEINPPKQRTALSHSPQANVRAFPNPAHAIAHHASPAKRFAFSPTIAACLQKEFLYLRRNTNQLYGFLAPVFMVFLFANRLSANGRLGGLIFPLSVAYSILGVSILSYNCLGMDGPGVQFYFLAPTRLRDVFFAKNLIGFLLVFVELVLIYVVIVFVGQPPSPVIAFTTISWLLFATFTNGAVGNLRSLSAPKKIDLSKISRKQTSQLSALIALGIAAACLCIGLGVDLLADHLHHPWLMVPIFLVLAAAGLLFYMQVLNRLDAIALTHRESLAEELCKT